MRKKKRMTALRGWSSPSVWFGKPRSKFIRKKKWMTPTQAAQAEMERQLVQDEAVLARIELEKRNDSATQS